MKWIGVGLLFGMYLQAGAQEHKLVKKWESDSLFKVPESVLYDPDHHFLYVTNIEGSDPWGKDGLGSIGRMDTKGNIIDADWISGFNAPKGMGLYHHVLYVADIDRVVIVDLHHGKIAATIEVPGAVALNDISIDLSGVIYVSDSKAKKVYRLVGNTPSVYLENLKGPNGILFRNGILYVLDDGAMYQVTAGKKMELIVNGLEGSVDGIEQLAADEFIVSTWSGVVYHVNAKTKTKQLLLDGRAAKINSADIGVDPATRTIYVPTFWKNTVVAYEVM